MKKTNKQETMKQIPLTVSTARAKIKRTPPKNEIKNQKSLYSFKKEQGIWLYVETAGQHQVLNKSDTEFLKAVNLKNNQVYICNYNCILFIVSSV